MKLRVTPLTIMAYKDTNFSSLIGTYKVNINPESYSHNHSVSFGNKKKVAEGAGNPESFNTIDTETVSFDIVFDGTPIFKSFTEEEVATQIEKFKELTYKYNGEIHRNNYLKLSWGTFLFYGYLTELNINYSMFKRDGDPLRAKASVSFSGFVDKELLAQTANKQSPDMSHIKRVMVTDTLPLFCDEIYGNPNLYMAVAYANNLDTFRELKIGGVITLPALEK